MTAIGQFLKRPRLINNVDIPMSTALDWGYEFSPWEALLYNENQVAAMLNPFAFFKGTMKVRITVAGHPYNLGKIAASYLPGHDNHMEHPDSGVYANPRAALTQILSRDPSWLDLSTSEGAVITCPFIYHYPFFALDRPQAEYAALGKIQMIMPSTLSNLNGSTDEVRLSFYAWVEDLEIRGSTTVRSDAVLAHQMAEENTHVISDTATAVADAAGALSEVPIVGPYARAMDVAARAGASVAKAFGFSRPTDHTPVGKVQQRITENMVNVNGPSDCTVISYDAKCEHIIDPRLTGCSQADELAFPDLGNRVHYLSTISLTNADFGPKEVWAVTPCYGMNENGGKVYGPVSYFANYFAYWYSTVEYTLTICSSTANRGTYVLAWDPMHSSDFDPGFVNSITFNLGETNVVKFTVPMLNQPLQTLQKTAFNGGDRNRSNGNMILSCLKPATGISGTTPPVSVVITARYPDIRFGGFKEPTNFILPSGAIVPTAMAAPATTSVRLSHQMFQEESGEATKVADDDKHDETMVGMAYHGESIRSARALCSSFAYLGTHTCVTSPTSKSVRMFLCSPTLGGYVSDGGFIRVATGGGSYHHACSTLPAIMWASFLGRSGSTRYKILARRDDGSKLDLGPARVTLKRPDTTVFNSCVTFQAAQTQELGPHTLLPTNNVISVQAPSNSNALYANYGMGHNLLEIEFNLQQSTTYHFDVYVADCEDTNYVCFRGIPLLVTFAKNP